jgi:hypothetical protein
VTPGPRVARVHITTSDNDAVTTGLYRDLAHADAMLSQAFTLIPAPLGRPFHRLSFTIVWTDGYQLADAVFLSNALVREGLRRGGILRHVLWRGARAVATHRLGETLRERGADLLSRLAASVEPDTGVDDRRNGWGGTWTGPTLLPDPVAAIGRLRVRYAARRPVVAATSADAPPAERYPATTHADVRYLVNFVSVALTHDLRAFIPERAEVVWEFWRAAYEAISLLLHLGDAADPYTDNEGFWIHQLPALAHLMTAPTTATRNAAPAALTFLPVGGVGEPYPAWVQALHGASGVYVIREHVADGTAPIVYVGSSKDRLYDTLTRHFQSWRRDKAWWDGHYTDNHDPGLTYDRATVTAAVILTHRDDARSLEYETIERLVPRDNIMGQAASVDADDAPWLDDDSPSRPAPSDRRRGRGDRDDAVPF